MEEHGRPYGETRNLKNGYYERYLGESYYDEDFTSKSWSPWFRPDRFLGEPGSGWATEGGPDTERQAHELRGRAAVLSAAGRPSRTGRGRGPNPHGYDVLE